MENLFETVLGMSVKGAVVIAAILLARLLLRRAPRVFSYALWAVALFRLLCPFSVESAFSLLPSARVVDVPGRGEAPAQVIRVETGISVINQPVNDFFIQHPYQGLPARPEDTETVPAPPVNQEEGAAADWRTVPAAIWLAGAALLLGYSLISLLRLRRRLVGYVPLEGEKNVRLADHIPSPFVLGVLLPRIYLPSGLPEGERDYILLHERTHIRRGDHIFRALAWLALAAHWFNPLVWLAFHLAGKDMELSCDEAVLRKMGRDIRADYSSSLLRLSAGRLPAGPLAFGSGDPQSRIKNILNYKKPALWVIAAALIAVVCAGAALATDPGPALDSPEPDDGLSYAFNDDRTAVLITGGKAENLQWFPPGRSDFADEMYPQGMMSFGELILSNGWDFSGGAFWAGDNRNAVKLELIHAPVVLDYTVLLSGPAYPEQAVIERKVSGDESMAPNLPDVEIAELATYFAHYLRAAEDWYQRQAGNIALDSLAADLTLSLDDVGNGPIVRIAGTAGGVELSKVVWNPEGSNAIFAEHPGGEVGMAEYKTGSWGAWITAWWADGSRTSVALSTKMSAMLSSYAASGWWEFTVDLDSGSVTEMNAQPLRQSTLLEETHYYPKSITDAEAVKAARIAAKLLTAAEDYYNNHTADLPYLYTALLGGAPFYSVDVEKTLTFDSFGEVLDLDDGADYEITRYTSVDLDGDGTQELILYVEQQGAFYFILHDMGGGLYGYGCGIKSMQHIKTDGTFHDRYIVPPEGDGMGDGYSSVSFAKTGLEFHPFTYEVTLPSREDGTAGNYRLVADGQPADSETYHAAVAAQGAKPDVVWYEFSPNDYGGGPIPAQPIVWVDWPGLDGLFFSDGWHESVNIEGLDVQEMYWYSPSQYSPQGRLFFTNPAFFGPAFAGRQIYGSTFWTDDSHTQMEGYLQVEDYPSLNFTIDIGERRVSPSFTGLGFSDQEMIVMAQICTLLMEQAEAYKTSGAYRPVEDGPLPFDRPMELEFASGAGAWQTMLLLHPDGSFVGDYSDADMTTEYVCQFHGRFRDITRVTDTSWSLTLDDLVLDTKYPIGREWNEGAIHYISSAPYGFDAKDGGPLEPGARFMFYTPEASGYRPTDELYGFNSANTDYDSIMYQFWTWMPSGRKIDAWGWDTKLGCYALCNTETGYGFFDLDAWGIG